MPPTQIVLPRPIQCSLNPVPEPPDPHAAAQPKKFSGDLAELAIRFEGRPATLAELLAATHGREMNLLLFFLGLPFLTPIPLPVVSSPFGLAVAVIGASVALGRNPWLPERLLQKELPARFLSRLLTASCRVVGWLENRLRPRWNGLISQPLYRRLTGLLIFLSGLLLLLPLPIPFTNTLPALTVVLLAAGSMERDGACILAGYFVCALSLAYFGLIFFGGTLFVENLWGRIFGW